MGTQARGRISIQNSGPSLSSKEIQTIRRKSLLAVKNINTISVPITITEQKLSFFDTVTFNKGPMFTIDQVNEEVLVNEDCFVKIDGEINFAFSNGKQFEVFLAQNEVSITPGNIGTGLASGRAGTIVSSGILEAKSGDTFTLRIKSLDGDLTIDILSSSVHIEYIDII